MKNSISTSAMPIDRDPLVDLATDRAATDAFDDRERDVAAVEREQRKQVEQRERQADEREQLQVDAEVRLDRLARNARDPDGARDVSATLRVTRRANPLPIAFVTSHVRPNASAIASPGE